MRESKFSVSSCCSVSKSGLTLCDTMNYSMPGSSLLHCLLKFPQIQEHSVGDAIYTSHPLPPSSPFAFSLSEHQGLFQWAGPSHQVAKVLKLPFQHQSFQWIYSRLISLGLTGLISLQFKGLSRVFSSTTIWKHQFFSTQPSLWTNSHIHTWLLEKLWLWLHELCWQSDVSAF